MLVFMSELRALSDTWIQRRERLQKSFMETCRPVDASQLTFEGASRAVMTEEEVRDLWREAPSKRQLSSRSPLNHVYVHVPFCKSICSFCNYERLRPSSPSVLRSWLARVKGSLDTIAPAVRHLRFHTLYFGGGTPSVLTAAMIREVVEAIHGALNFHPLARRTFELDPAVMNRDKLSALRQLGFSHFSFGVQTLDADVNAAHNRGRQGRDIVARRFDEFAAEGVHRVSCDFLLGMAGTTPAQVFAEIQEALQRWRPQWVDIYQLTPTDEYLQSHFDGDADAFWAHLKPFQEQAPAALARVARACGYRFRDGGGHRYALLLRPSPRDLLRIGRKGFGELLSVSPYGYTQTISDQRRPMNLLGLGPSARSRIYGVARFEARDPGDDPSAPGPAHYHGRAVDLKSESLSYLVFTLRDGDRLDRKEFKAIFGADVLDLHGEAIAAWSRQGYVAELGRRHLTLVAQGRQERLATLLWLVASEDLESDIARHRGLDLSPSGLAHHLRALSEGDAVGAYTLAGFSTGRLRLSGDSGPVQLRVIPPLDDGGRMSLVVESGLPTTPEGQRDLRKTVTALKRIFV